MLLSDPAGYVAELDYTLSFTAAAMGAIFTGVARAAFEEALAYTRGRIQGGKPICEHQLVQKHLYDMFARVETSRALSRAAMIYNQSGAEIASEYATAAKIYCTQAAYEVADAAGRDGRPRPEQGRLRRETVPRRPRFPGGRRRQRRAGPVGNPQGHGAGGRLSPTITRGAEHEP
ncbi:MAG: acyl-CoA dehydrogenase family protein [Pseudomonadota bacterium]|nr:acyl-CoA dehydrogenase family protein [Pseudomonadota bacterium]